MTGAFFLKLAGINGESKSKGREGWIDVLNFSHGAVKDVSGPTVMGEFLPFIFTHTVDMATPKIQKACMDGMMLGRAELVYIRGANVMTPVYEILLEDIKISRTEVRTEKPDGFNSPLPVEEVRLSAQKMTWKVYPSPPAESDEKPVKESFDRMHNE